MPSEGAYAVFSTPRLGKGQKWYVVRKRDDRIMTEGSVYQCLRWVTVWGPMRAHG